MSLVQLASVCVVQFEKLRFSPLTQVATCSLLVTAVFHSKPVQWVHWNAKILKKVANIENLTGNYIAECSLTYVCACLSVAMLHLSSLLKPNSLQYIFVKMTVEDNRLLMRRQLQNLMNVRHLKWWDLMLPLEGDSFIFPLKMDRSCLMLLMANRNLFRAQRSGLSPIKILHFLKKIINVICIFRQELHKSDKNSMWIVFISTMYVRYDVVANYKPIVVFKTSQHTCD